MIRALSTAVAFSVVLCLWLGRTGTGLSVAQTVDCEESPPWANKLFEERSQEVSKPKPGEVVKHRFTMKNVYKVPLDITRVQIANADGATYSITNKTLQPGQTGALEVTVDPKRIAVGKDLKMYVSVGPQYTSTATLTLKVKETK